MNLKPVALAVWNVYTKKITHQSSMLWPRLASTLLWKTVRSEYSSLFWGKFVSELYLWFWPIYLCFLVFRKGLTQGQSFLMH